MSSFTTELLVFIIFATCATAIASYLIYWVLNSSPISRWFHDSVAVAPTFLAITSFIFGLSISTLAGYSFENHKHAVTNLITESNAVDTIISAASALPAKDQVQIKQGIENYLSSVIRNEWPAMANRDVKMREVATPDFLILNNIINKIAYEPNQSSAISSQLLSAIEDIRHDRKIRLALAYDDDSLARWPSVPVCSFLLLLSVGIIHIKSHKSMKVSLGIASLSVITALLLLFIIVSPYRGWHPIEPKQLENSMELLNALKTQ